MAGELEQPRQEAAVDDATDASHSSRGVDDGSHFGLNLVTDSLHSVVAKLVGSDKHVLELGCGTGNMSRLFRDAGCRVVGVESDPDAAAIAEAACERVIVADLDAEGSAAQLGDDRFDVIVAVDVLEHLKDPASLLRELAPHLSEDGHLAVVLPNVTHGSVRLAMLEGRFPYSSLGLLDHAHLRFFSRSGVFELFERAGYGVEYLDGIDKSLLDSEVPFDPAAVPRALRVQLDNDRDARIYHFVALARPAPAGLPAFALAQLHSLHEELAASRRTLDADARELDRLSRELRRAADDATELRGLLHEAHQMLATRDHEIETTSAELAVLDKELNGARHRLAEQRSELERVTAARDDAVARVWELDAELKRQAAEVVPPLVARIDSMQSELDGMHATRAWRLAKRYWRLARRLSRAS